MSFWRYRFRDWEYNSSHFKPSEILLSW